MSKKQVSEKIKIEVSPDKGGLTFLFLAAVLLTMALLRTPGVRAQDPASEVGEPVGPARLLLELAGVPEPWLEITPLDEELLPPLVIRPRLGEGEVAQHLDLPPTYLGHLMICLGAEPPWAVRCAAVELLAGEELPLFPSQGLSLTGTYLSAGLPVVGARIALVPEGLQALRPFHLPLGPSEGSLRREALSDGEGHFRLRPVAAGDYLLEVLLPTGRVLHSESISLPSPAAFAVSQDSQSWPALDLGRIEIDDGLAIEFKAIDAEDRPIEGVRITARQGVGPEDLISFETETDADGLARITGFRLSDEVRLVCSATGFLPQTSDHELLPVEHRCRLIRPARVRGRLESLTGPVLLGGRVEIIALDPDKKVPLPSGVGLEGGFAIDGLWPGEYRLTGSAPGYEEVERSFFLAAGEALDLETLYLNPGRRVRALVIDAQRDTPIAGALLRARSPAHELLAESDEAGFLSFSVPRERASLLWLEAAGYAGRELSLRAPEDPREELVLELAPGGAILASVRRGQERPCLGCRLRIEPSGEELITDKRGEALSGTLAPGLYKVWISRISHRGSTLIEEARAESRQVRVRADRLTRVEFQLGKAELSLLPRPALDPSWVLAMRAGKHQQQRRQQRDGRYTFTRPEPSGLPVHIEIHYFDPLSQQEAQVRIATLDLEEVGAEVELAVPRTLIRGRLRRRGRPLPGVEIRMLSLRDATTRARLHSAPDGRFQVPYLAPGFYSLVIGDRPLKTVHARPGRPIDLGTFEVADGF